MQVQVTAIRHKGVKGNEVPYLKLEALGEDLLMQVGEGTIKKIEDWENRAKTAGETTGALSGSIATSTEEQKKNELKAATKHKQ